MACSALIRTRPSTASRRPDDTPDDASDFPALTLPQRSKSAPEEAGYDTRRASVMKTTAVAK